MLSLLRTFRTSRAPILARPSVRTPSQALFRTKPLPKLNFSTSAPRKEFSKDVKSSKSLQNETPSKWATELPYFVIGGLGGVSAGVVVLAGVWAVWEWQCGAQVRKFMDWLDKMKSGASMAKVVEDWRWRKENREEEGGAVKEGMENQLKEPMDDRGDRGLNLETPHDGEMGTKGLNEGQENIAAKTERGAERGLINRGLGGRPQF